MSSVSILEGSKTLLILNSSIRFNLSALSLSHTHKALKQIVLIKENSVVSQCWRFCAANPSVPISKPFISSDPSA